MVFAICTKEGESGDDLMKRIWKAKNKSVLGAGIAEESLQEVQHKKCRQGVSKLEKNAKFSHVNSTSMLCI